MPRCPRCGREVGEDARYCPYCGRRIAKWTREEKLKLVLMLCIIYLLIVAATVLETIRKTQGVFGEIVEETVENLMFDLEDGKVYTREFEIYCSYLKVSLTSVGDYIRVKIIVDNKVIYDKKAEYVSIEYNLPPGRHTIRIVIENPSESIIPIGPKVQVIGKIVLANNIGDQNTRV